MNAYDLPAPGTIAAKIDLAVRLRIFDFGGSLATANRELSAAFSPASASGFQETIGRASSSPKSLRDQ